MQMNDEFHEAAVAELRSAAAAIMADNAANYLGFLIVAHAWSLSELAQIVGAKEAATCASNSARRLVAMVEPMARLATAVGVDEGRMQ